MPRKVVLSVVGTFVLFMCSTAIWIFYQGISDTATPTPTSKISTSPNNDNLQKSPLKLEEEIQLIDNQQKDTQKSLHTLIKLGTAIFGVLLTGLVSAAVYAYFLWDKMLHLDAGLIQVTEDSKTQRSDNQTISRELGSIDSALRGLYNLLNERYPR